jgi:WD40 repeat protein/serine/threonine protein kinase
LALSASLATYTVANEQRVLGDFRIVREVGRGGMGIVYEAEQISLRRRVALKVLTLAAALDSRQRQRFQLEAQAAGRLHHNHIVPVHAVGEADGTPYLAMEFIDGLSLAHVIRQLRLREASAPDTRFSREEVHRSARVEASARPRSSASAPSTAPTLTGCSPGDRAYIVMAAHLGIQAAQALEHAHQHGILHRDIKPANILVDDKEHLWITDFGVAQIQGNASLTVPGLVIGTLRYMSPEQALGRHAALDGRCDVYSLGATLYELLTLHPALDGTDRSEVLRRVAHDEPVALRKLNPSVPHDIETIVRKMMAKEPRDRYATAQGVADDLERFLRGEPIAARPASWFERSWKTARRHPAWAGAAVSALLLLSLFIGMLSWSNIRLRDKNWQLDQTNAQLDQARNEAVAQARVARRSSAAAQTRLAQLALERGQVELAQGLLDAIRPGTGESDFAWSYLTRQAQRDVVVLQGDGASIHTAAVAKDRTTLATGDAAGRVVLWDLARRQRISDLRSLGQPIHDLAFTPDGRRLVASAGHWGENGKDELVIWDMMSNPPRVMAQLAGRLPGPHVPTYLDDDRVIVFRTPGDPADERLGAALSTTCLSGLREGLLVPAWNIQWLYHMIPIPGDESHFIGINSVGDVTLHRWSTGAIERTLGKGLSWRPNCVHGTRDGRRLVVVTSIREICVLELESGRELASYGLPFLPDRMVLSGDERQVVLWRHDARLALLDLSTGHCWKIQSVIDGVSGFALSADGRRVALSSSSLRAVVHDVASGAEIGRLPLAFELPTALEFTPDGRTLIVGGFDGDVAVWTFDRPSPSCDVADKGDELWALAWSPDGRTIAAAGDDGVLRLRSAASLQVIRSWRGHTALITALAWSPDGHTIASASYDRTVRLWNADTGQPAATFEGHTDRIRPLAWSPDGRLLASAGWDRTIRIWDLAGGKTVVIASTHTDAIRALAWSPDGHALASAGNDRAISLWTPEGRSLLTWHGHAECHALAWSPDGQALASADEHGHVTLWNHLELPRRTDLHGHTGVILALAWSPDGRYIASAGLDQSVRIWDAMSGLETLVLTGHKSQVNAVAWSPDSQGLATGDKAGVLRFWLATSPSGGAVSPTVAQGRWSPTF